MGFDKLIWTVEELQSRKGMDFFGGFNMSNEKRGPGGCLGYMGDEILPSYTI